MFNATYYVHGHFDSQSRLPLLHKETISVDDYAAAWFHARALVQRYRGQAKMVVVMCDGPNQNYNSRSFTLFNV